MLAAVAALAGGGWLASQPTSGNQTTIPPTLNHSYQVQLNTNATLDPSHHQDTIHMPTNMKLTLVITNVEPPAIMNISGAPPFVTAYSTGIAAPLVKEPDGEWAFRLRGSGTVAGYVFVQADFTGHISQDGNTITGAYTLGANGVFPGGNPVTYLIKPKPAATPAPTAESPATATQPPPQSTPTPAAATATASAPPTLAATSTVTATPDVPGNGDVNKDGNVDSIDAELILQDEAGLLQLSERERANADVNQDGVMDSRDASLVLQHTAGLFPNLPVPPPN